MSGTLYINKIQTANTSYTTYISLGQVPAFYNSHSQGVLISADGEFRPSANGAINSGASNYRWKGIFSAAAVNVSSDRNLKYDFKTFDETHEKFFMSLLPQTYKFKDGESGRTHFGFISQDVEDNMAELGMTSLDFAGFCKDVKTKPIYDENGEVVKDETVYDENGNPEYEYSLRYTEFIALNTYMIQKLYKRIEELENKVYN